MSFLRQHCYFCSPVEPSALNSGGTQGPVKYIREGTRTWAGQTAKHSHSMNTIILLIAASYSHCDTILRIKPQLA